MVIVWSVRNSASPQELQSQELGGRKAGLKRGRESLHSLPVRLSFLTGPCLQSTAPIMPGSLRECSLHPLALP